LPESPILGPVASEIPAFGLPFFSDKPQDASIVSGFLRASRARSLLSALT
jgi:hypothetical protein